ncbi:MAG: glycosyltransferase family 2 protein [Candidatus Omnitrophota bacterium]
MKVWIVIPACNEGETLKQLLRELKKRGSSTLVIDDGSKDNTLEIAKKEADAIIRNETNLGKGGALKKGIAYLLENNNFEYIITMDGDGQHSPLDLENFLDEAQKGEYFIVGNRMGNHLGMSRIRVITNKFMSWFISKIVGQKIPDTQCGFRLIKKEVLERIRIKTNKFEVESEIIIKAAKAGFLIRSIPIRSIYSKHQRSKIHPLADTLRFIKFIVGKNNLK